MCKCFTPYTICGLKNHIRWPSVTLTVLKIFKKNFEAHESTFLLYNATTVRYTHHPGMPTPLNASAIELPQTYSERHWSVQLHVVLGGFSLSLYVKHSAWNTYKNNINGHVSLPYVMRATYNVIKVFWILPEEMILVSKCYQHSNSKEWFLTLLNYY